MANINGKDYHPFDLTPFRSQCPPMAIIIGTIPPHRFCYLDKERKERGKLEPGDIDFYYGSKDNDFWGLIQKVFPNSFERNEESIRAFLNKHKIVMIDTIKSCRRKDNNSASDKNLYDPGWNNDIIAILNDNPSIQFLFYTSQMVKSHICRIFKSYHHYIHKDDKRRCLLKINNAEYECFVLYSPSRQALINMGKDGKAKRQELYKKYFKMLIIQ